MTTWTQAVMVAAVAALLVGSACGNPPPTCAATETAFTICSDGSVWECPVATQAQLDKKKAIDDQCNHSVDPTGCMLTAKYEQYPMTVKAKCEEGGEVCVQTAPPAKSASCQAK